MPTHFPEAFLGSGCGGVVSAAQGIEQGVSFDPGLNLGRDRFHVVHIDFPSQQPTTIADCHECWESPTIANGLGRKFKDNGGMRE
jgi:hypothetical protein